MKNVVKQNSLGVIFDEIQYKDLFIVLFCWIMELVVWSCFYLHKARNEIFQPLMLVTFDYVEHMCFLCETPLKIADY